MLSPWLQHIDVQLSGCTFAHESFDLFTNPGQAWLKAAMREVRFEVRLSAEGRASWVTGNELHPYLQQTHMGSADRKT